IERCDGLIDEAGWHVHYGELRGDVLEERVEVFIRKTLFTHELRVHRAEIATTVLFGPPERPRHGTDLFLNQRRDRDVYEKPFRALIAQQPAVEPLYRREHYRFTPQLFVQGRSHVG